MDGIHIADGFDIPDRVAFGLGAWNLLALVAGVLLAIAVAHSPLPGAVALPLAMSIGLVAAGLAWLRLAGHSLLEWTAVAARFALGPRTGTLHVVPATAGAAAPLHVMRGGRDGDAMAQRAGRSNAATGARRIAVLSCEPGAGRTAIACELACLLAQPRRDGLRRGAAPRVALLDLDTERPSLAARLRLQPSHDLLGYALAEPDRRRALSHLSSHASGVRVLAGLPRPAPQAWPLTAGLVREVLREMDMEGFDLVVADAGAESSLAAAAAMAADELLVVLTATPTGVSAAYRCTEWIRQIGAAARVEYVVNRVRRRVDVAQMESDLGGCVVSEIPEEPAFDSAPARGALVSGGTSAAAVALRRLARRLRDRPLPAW